VKHTGILIISTTSWYYQYPFAFLFGFHRFTDFEAIYHYNGVMCQVLKDDHVASGLCCIQLFMNSMSQEEALRHLGHAKV
jgi:hypothetical protein